MVKKGLSLEQKRDIILELFHEHDDVYQLKEIEKKAAARGVTLQSIKDVVQSLVDDDLVHQVIGKPFEDDLVGLVDECCTGSLTWLMYAV